MLYFMILLSVIIASCNTINYDVDPIIEMLMNDNIIEEYSENNDETEDRFILNTGIWECGSCTDLKDIIYKEIYDFDLNKFEKDHEVQIGLSVDGMRCVTVKANDEAAVSIVSGSCSGELTLKLVHTERCQINIYS